MNFSEQQGNVKDLSFKLVVHLAITYISFVRMNVIMWYCYNRTKTSETLSS